MSIGGFDRLLPCVKKELTFTSRGNEQLVEFIFLFGLTPVVVDARSG